MCLDPVVAGALAVGTRVISATQEAKAHKQAGKYNQQVLMQQAALNSARARRAHQAADVETAEATDRLRQTVGSGRAAYAANGLLLDGAPTDAPNMWERDQAALLAYEQGGIADAADAEAWGFNAQAGIDAANAKWARQSGRNAAWGALLGGVADSAGIIRQTSALKKQGGK